jgi:hypothetical protein
MVRPWVIDEMKDVDLKDKRLNSRLAEVLSQLGGHPTASIPAACGGYAEMAAAYRLFDNDKVGFDNVLESHIEATHERMAKEEVVILPQDTTEIDLTRPEQQVLGAGPLDGGTRCGVFLHLLHAFTPDGTSLGTVHATVWAREQAPLPLPPASERCARRKHTPIEAKESHRWIQTLRQARAEARRAPKTRFVCVADSEGDIYELLVEGQAQPPELDWIVRACRDRALDDGHAHSTEETELGAAANRLREQVLVSCDRRSRRQPRRSRTAEVEVRAGRVSLRPPWRPDRKLPQVAVNVVLVREINPPADDVPVEWILLTSLPIDDAEQVRQVIQYYCVRWMIEIVFRTLKSGCRVEGRRFEQVDRFLPCLAVYLIVTWRTLYVCHLSRAFPEISCETLFEPAEWKSASRVVRRQPVPSRPPSLSAMVRLVAQLGGYVDRKRPDKPGPQTVWLGLQRLHDIALCWQLFGPEARTEDKLV